jgi:hypothetical protein
MTQPLSAKPSSVALVPAAAGCDDCRVERLLVRLPARVQSPVRWLLRPSSRWMRIPAGILLIVGGFLAILPLFGLWMLPLGLILLAEDVTLLRRLRNGTLNWIARHRPQWFAEPASGTTRSSYCRHHPSDLSP